MEDRKPPTGLSRTALVAIVGTGVGFVVSYTVQLVLAARYGTVGELDAFIGAQTIPNLIWVLVTGTVNVTFIPVYMRAREQESPVSARRFSLQATAITGLLMAAVGLLGMMLAPALVRFTLPGFTAEQAQLTIDLQRILFPAYTILGLSGLINIWCYARNMVGWAVGIPLVGNAAFLLVTLIWGQVGRIEMVAWGFLVNAMLQLVMSVALFLLADRNARSEPGGSSKDHLRSFLLLSAPFVLGVFFAQSNPLIDRFFLSDLPAGVVSSLNFALKLVLVVNTVVAAGLSKVMLPELSRLEEQAEHADSLEIVKKGFFAMLFVVVPLFVFLSLFADEFVRILFARGAFDEQSIRSTADGLRAYIGVGILGGSSGILANYFFARHQHLFVVGVSAISFVLTIVFDLFFVDWWGGVGVAISYSLALSVVTCLYLAGMSKKNGGASLLNWAWEFVRLSLGALLAGGVVRMAFSYLKLPAQLLPILVTATAGMAVFLVSQRLLGTYAWRVVRDSSANIRKR